MAEGINVLCFLLGMVGIVAAGCLLALLVFSVMNSERQPSKQEQHLAQIAATGKGAREAMDNLSNEYLQRIRQHAQKKQSYNGFEREPTEEKTRRRKGEAL